MQSVWPFLCFLSATQICPISSSPPSQREVDFTRLNFREEKSDVFPEHDEVLRQCTGGVLHASCNRISRAAGCEKRKRVRPRTQKARLRRVLIWKHQWGWKKSTWYSKSNPGAYLRRRAGSCSTAACRSWHCSRSCRCRPAGIPPCTRRPTRCRSTRPCRSPRRRSPDVAAGRGYRTGLRERGDDAGHFIDWPNTVWLRERGTNKKEELLWFSPDQYAISLSRQESDEKM